MQDEFEKTTVIQVQENDPVEKMQNQEEPGSNKDRKKPKKKKKLTKAGVRFFQILLVVSLCTAAYSGWKLYVGLKQYQQAQASYQDLAGDVIDANKFDLNHAKKEETIQFDKLKEINSDFCGWLILPETIVNYPVVHGSDNEYYLEHLFTGDVNHTGCIFIDSRNSDNFADQNTCMYAHHMRNGSMFAELENYRDAKYYDDHKELIYKTAEQNYKIEPFAAVLTNGSDDILHFNFKSEDEFMKYIEAQRNRSELKTDLEIKPTDKIVTMITCSYRVQDGRYAVFGKLTPIDE